MSRRLRNQIHEIHPHLGMIESRELAQELQAWVDLKPVLLSLSL